MTAPKAIASGAVNMYGHFIAYECGKH